MVGTVVVVAVVDNVVEAKFRRIVVEASLLFRPLLLLSLLSIDTDDDFNNHGRDRMRLSANSSNTSDRWRTEQFGTSGIGDSVPSAPPPLSFRPRRYSIRDRDAILSSFTSIRISFNVAVGVGTDAVVADDVVVVRSTLSKGSSEKIVVVILSMISEMVLVALYDVGVGCSSSVDDIGETVHAIMKSSPASQQRCLP